MPSAPRIGFPDQERLAIAAGLSRVLADSYTLYLKTHNYHWNVVGPMFHSLHTMFEVQYTELGEPAPGTYREFAALATVSEDTDRPDAQEMIRRLVDAQETTARTIREVLPLAEAAPDQVSTDLLVRRLDVHEKTAWMLRSLLA